MRAIAIDPASKCLREVILPLPDPQPREIRIRVAYAGVNHADLFQVQGRYPLPETTQNIPGLEVSGRVDAVGDGVSGFEVGQAVCALLEGGGYAEYVTVNAQLCFSLPDRVTLESAAALPEALATSWHALIYLGTLKKGEHVFISGGASGVGSIALQLAHSKGAHIYTSASTAEKAAYCASLGAEVIASGKEAIVELARHEKMDVILDMIAGEMINPYLKLLRYGGRLISIAAMESAETSLSMAGLLMKNLSWHGMTLRSQSLEIKTLIIQELSALYNAISAPVPITPRIDRIFPLVDAAQAHAYMESRRHIGKILLKS